jgi:hypothetical protein
LPAFKPHDHLSRWTSQGKQSPPALESFLDYISKIAHFEADCPTVSSTSVGSLTKKRGIACILLALTALIHSKLLVSLGDFAFIQVWHSHGEHAWSPSALFLQHVDAPALLSASNTSHQNHTFREPLLSTR